MQTNNHSLSCCLLASLFFLCATLGNPLRVQSESDPAQNKKRDAKLKAYQQLAANFSISTTEQHTTPFLLHPKPLQLWSNPLRPAPYGATFLWTSNNRPVAIGCIYEWFGENNRSVLCRELKSLSPDPLIATHQNRRIWTPQKQGIEFQQFPDSYAMKQQGTPQLQAKRLARHFSARMLKLLEQRDFELRLLPRPIYEYNDKTTDHYSALFSFVQATDPEAILFLKRSKDNNSKWQWQFALARMTSGALSVKFDKKTVWSVEEIKPETLGDKQSPYVVFWDGSIRLPELAQDK